MNDKENAIRNGYECMISSKNCLQIEGEAVPSTLKLQVSVPGPARKKTEMPYLFTIYFK